MVIALTFCAQDLRLGTNLWPKSVHLLVKWLFIWIHLFPPFSILLIFLHALIILVDYAHIVDWS